METDLVREDEVKRMADRSLKSARYHTRYPPTSYCLVVAVPLPPQAPGYTHKQQHALDSSAPPPSLLLTFPLPS